ncbi:catecholate siderophore receptor Fiu [Dokdonella fugitiva]|uniref:Catecholate siderophore receptor n=1 Tax=Dokdonella fugitiva TaxID=328517 RepID=A0A4R2I4W6_9GAMM|nr:catecholate siderophore receptor Fiu [Dokdonella fugitiva]TCO38922.1 catecholate siderophore receptor [Dokdonella fugitiva]
MSYIKSRKHPVACGPRTTAATLATGIALAMSPLHAADADADALADAAGANSLPTINVEGHAVEGYKVDTMAGPKYLKPLVDTTQTIQIIAADLIQEQAATTLTEALRNSAGVGTFYAGENGNTSTGDTVYMRGFDSSGSIYVDGVRDLGGISRDTFNVDQIEVTKGPSGSDYGRTAPSGSINLVSKQPLLAERIGGTVAYGSGNQKRATADWNTRIDGLDGAAFRLNVMAQDSGVPGRHEVERDRWGIAPTFAFGLGTPTRVFLDLLHLKQDNVPDGAIPTIGLPGYTSPDPTRPGIGAAPRVDPYNFYGTRDDHDDSKTDMATLLVEHDFSDDLKLVNTTRWGRTHQQYLITSFTATAANLATPDITDPSTWTLKRSNPNFKDLTNRILTNQTNLRVHSEFGRVGNDVSTGVEFTREDAISTGLGALNGSTWPAANLYRPDAHVGGLVWGRNGAYGDGRTDTEAAYLFDTITFDERWQANAGVRLDHYDTDYRSAVVCTTSGVTACGSLPAGTIVPGANADKSGTLFNWKAGLLYKPTADSSVYLNYGVSQQPPGGNSLAFSTSASSLDNPIFDPQKAKTGELGTKWELFDAKLLLTAALYRTDISNEIVQDPVDQLYYQVGKKRVEGVELGLVGRISEAWSISAGYTSMDATVEKGGHVSQDGSDDLAYTPDAAFTAWTTYRTPFGLVLGGGARYTGEMKRGNDGAIGTPTKVDAWWVFDAMASYPVNEHFDLQLNVYNLFDRDYVAAINKSGYRYNPGAPRSAMLTASFRF